MHVGFFFRCVRDYYRFHLIFKFVASLLLTKFVKKKKKKKGFNVIRQTKKGVCRRGVCVCFCGGGACLRRSLECRTGVGLAIFLTIHTTGVLRQVANKGELLLTWNHVRSLAPRQHSTSYCTKTKKKHTQKQKNTTSAMDDVMMKTRSRWGAATFLFFFSFMFWGEEGSLFFFSKLSFCLWWRHASTVVHFRAHVVRRSFRTESYHAREFDCILYSRSPVFFLFRHVLLSRLSLWIREKRNHVCIFLVCCF